MAVAHYDLRFVKPIDEALLHEVFGQHKKIVTLEDGCIMGGMGSAVLEFMAAARYHADVVCLGIPDRFVEQGTPEQLHEACGYDVNGIEKAVSELLGR